MMFAYDWGAERAVAVAAEAAGPVVSMRDDFAKIFYGRQERPQLIRRG